MSDENILRKKYDIPFVQIPREILVHKELSWKAKGLIAYLLDKPDNWKFTISGIAAQGKESEKAIASGLRELKKFGYLKIISIKDPLTGRYAGTAWDITPFSNNFSETPFSAFRQSEPRKSGISNTIDKKEERERSTLTFSYKRVKMPNEKFEALVKDFGEEKIKEKLERLEEYADINPKRFKQYACHATVIRKWIREDQANPMHKNGQSSKIVSREKIAARMKWAKANTWTAPGGSAFADNVGYHIISGNGKPELHKFEAHDPFWTDKEL